MAVDMEREKRRQEFLEAVKGRLIVSCQALPGEPLYVEEKSVMYLMARAAAAAGAAAIRTCGVRDVTAIRQETQLPVIGLIKVQYEGYESYITPTLREVEELAKAGSDVVALDCTARKRGDGRTAGEYLKLVRERFPELILMADISTHEEGMNAWRSGADLLGTTMSGYTSYSPKLDGPDLELMRRLSAQAGIPVIGEGRIHTPEQAVEALRTGVWSIVVGGAITRPLEIAGRFVRAIEKDVGMGGAAYENCGA